MLTQCTGQITCKQIQSKNCLNHKKKGMSQQMIKNLFAYHLLSIFLRSRHKSQWLKVYLRSAKHKQNTKKSVSNMQGCLTGNDVGAGLTFQSSDVTSLLLGTSWPPSRMQCLRTSCVEELLLFSLRFQIRAVESPDLQRARGSELNTLISLCVVFIQPRLE